MLVYLVSVHPLARVTRAAYREEKIPAAVLWWLAADGMHGWYAMLRKGLEAPLGGREAAEREIGKAIAKAYTRRWEVLRAQHPGMTTDDGAPARILGALTHSARHPKGAWAYRLFGAPPTRRRDALRVERELLGTMTMQERWREVTTHLGEVLIALTQTLPKVLPGANAVLGQICFAGGRKTAERAKKIFALPDTPESAIEVLRMSEYVFRVNPEHWHEADAKAHTGMLEGTACPWWSAPGWSMMHCGIFGQFQSGISSVFGLRYQLTQTIPKHGGSTCRIDLRPITKKDGTPVGLAR